MKRITKIVKVEKEFNEEEKRFIKFLNDTVYGVQGIRPTPNDSRSRYTCVPKRYDVKMKWEEDD